MASVRKRTWSTGAGDQRAGWSVDFTDNLGKRQRRQFGTKREADDFRVSVEAQLRAGTFRGQARTTTVLAVSEQYLVHCEARMQRHERMSRHNLNVYRGHVRNYICGQGSGKRISFPLGLGAFTLSSLTSATLGEFRDHLRDHGLSVPTVRKILATFKLVLDFAIARDLLSVNPAKGIKVIGRRDEGARRVTPPSKEALRQLLEVAGSDFRVKLAFASATGVRAGELHALRWRHIDLQKGEVAIETRVDAYRSEDVPKTAAGVRGVPLGAAVVRLLKEWKLRSGWSGADDLVFPNKTGGYVSHANMVKREFLPLFGKLEGHHAADPNQHPRAPVRFNWHALRHFAVSCWIEAGLSPKTVQTFAGHSSLQVTMDRYGHLFPSEKHREAMDEIAKGLFG